MKMAVVSSGHIPSQWAHSINVMKVAHVFHRLGHDVEVLTVERFWENKMRRRIKDNHRFYGISDAINVVYFRDNLLFYFEEVKPFSYILWALKKVTENRLGYILDPEKKISQYCAEKEVDICYCRSYRTAYYNIRNKIPTILESHTTNTTHPDLQIVIKLSHSEYFKVLVTISNILKQGFINAGVPPYKILVLEDGVDINSFRDLPNKEKTREILKLPKSEKIVVYCGSLFPDKGIEHILLVAKDVSYATFLLVGGRNQQINIWKKYAKSHEIKNVQFVGFVENSKVPLYLVAADALIMPYKTDQKITIMDINTTSPLKLFEYMAAKKPIISSDIPAISRTITSGVDGLLAEPNNIKELTKFVATVLNDQQLARRLAGNAFRKVQGYSWEMRCDTVFQYCGLTENGQ